MRITQILRFLKFFAMFPIEYLLTFWGTISLIFLSYFQLVFSLLIHFLRQLSYSISRNKTPSIERPQMQREVTIFLSFFPAPPKPKHSSFKFLNFQRQHNYHKVYYRFFFLHKIHELCTKMTHYYVKDDFLNAKSSAGGSAPLESRLCGIVILANTVTIHNGPDPIYIIQDFCINPKFISLATSISEAGNTIDCPGVIRFGVVSEKIKIK